MQSAKSQDQSDQQKGHLDNSVSQQNDKIYAQSPYRIQNHPRPEEEKGLLKYSNRVHDLTGNDPVRCRLTYGPGDDLNCTPPTRVGARINRPIAWPVSMGTHPIFLATIHLLYQGVDHGREVNNASPLHWMQSMREVFGPRFSEREAAKL